MTKFRWAVAAITIAAMAALPASASLLGPAPQVQGPASATLSPVTVTPEKANPLVSPESQFVKLHLPQTLSDQYPRFRDAICVQVIGLPPEYDAFVAKRIVDLAEQVHAPVAKANPCLANVHVIFTPQPQAQINDIAKRRDILIGFHFPSGFEKLTTVVRPIQSWYTTRTRDATGNSWIEVDNPCPIVGDPVNPCQERPRGLAGSRLSNGMSAEVVHSLILADSKKVAGEKIDAMADYIAVLALAKWDHLDRCNGLSSILSMLADNCPEAPHAVTSTDVALLKGLYSVDKLENGSQQRASIASSMTSAKTDEARR
jgi:hypothetical protein